MRSKYIIITTILIVMLTTQFASAGYWDEREDLAAILAADDTNIDKSGQLSSVASYHLSKNLYEQNISVGMVKLYNARDRVAYYFCYYTTEEGYFVYIDPATDAMYTYREARHRLSSGIEIRYAIYYLHYPYSYNEGSGEASDQLKQRYESGKE